MNRRLGMAASAVNALSVAGFAVSMLLGFSFGSYLCSCFIGLSFLVMMSVLVIYVPRERKAAGCAAVGFSAVYVALILLVYFAQLTTVRLDALSREAMAMLDYSRFGLFFNYDLLGYGMMALSTFFAGLAIIPQSRPDRWLKALFMIHGVFFLSCFAAPMLGVFHAGMEDGNWIGVALLEFWCLYFLPAGVLSWRYFSKKEE